MLQMPRKYCARSILAHCMSKDPSSKIRWTWHFKKRYDFMFAQHCLYCGCFQGKDTTYYLLNTVSHIVWFCAFFNVNHFFAVSFSITRQNHGTGKPWSSCRRITWYFNLQIGSCKSSWMSSRFVPPNLSERSRRRCKSLMPRLPWLSHAWWRYVFPVDAHLESSYLTMPILYPPILPSAVKPPSFHFLFVLAPQRWENDRIRIRCHIHEFCKVLIVSKVLISLHGAALWHAACRPTRASGTYPGIHICNFCVCICICCLSMSAFLCCWKFYRLWLRVQGGRQIVSTCKRVSRMLNCCWRPWAAYFRRLIFLHFLVSLQRSLFSVTQSNLSFLRINVVNGEKGDMGSGWFCVCFFHNLIS